MEDIKAVIISALSELQPEIIYIFGSFLSEYYNDRSDIDIAFYSEQETDPYQSFLLGQNISRELGREVDLVPLKTASTVFQRQILETGQLIFEKEALFRQQFELLVLKKYLKLNEERQEIIEHYGAEK